MGAWLQMVIHFPTDYGPDEIQDQLTQLTSSFCVKSAGKAAVAGVMLPVAVGLEVIAGGDMHACMGTAVQCSTVRLC